MLSEIKKDKKKLIKDPIKRMSYNGSGSAREVVRMIALALGFKIHEDEYGISAYGGNAIRIADHCTYMQTWVDRGTWNAPIRLDVVIEEKPTQAVTQVKKGFDFTIVEFVYNITEVDTQNARTIAYDIRNVINGNQYANNARGERRPLKSTHSSNENKQYNKNRNMKQTIKLRESELKRMIAESVKKLLKEAAYDINSDEYKQAYDRDNDENWRNNAKEKLQTEKEIADYEALPEKARHPYGTERPSFNKWYNRWENRFRIDKLAQKEPNSVYKKQQAKRENDIEQKRHFPFSKQFTLWCFLHNIDTTQLDDYELLDLYERYWEER